MSIALTVDGKTVAPGQVAYPGFHADVLWKFHWYSLLNQLLVWTTIALVFGALIDCLVVGPGPNRRLRRANRPPSHWA